jgi:hypothetical protein
VRDSLKSESVLAAQSADAAAVSALTE